MKDNNKGIFFDETGIMLSIDNFPLDRLADAILYYCIQM